MFLDPDAFGFTDGLRACFEVAREEIAGWVKEEVPLWPDAAAYSGEWRMAPLFAPLSTPTDALRRPRYASRCVPHHIDVVIDDHNRELCPRTFDAVSALPTAHSAAVSWLEPGTHIYPHVDLYQRDVLRAHLTVLCEPGALMRAAGVTHEYTEGAVTVFDGQCEHEVGNLSNAPRAILLVDFALTPVEREVVLAANPSRDDR